MIRSMTTNEAVSKCSISKSALICSKSRKAIHLRLNTQYDLPDLRGRQEYIEYFED